ncbi:MAG: LytTR family DNA-binding domain-containing protein [Bacteroidota bacterium]
MPYIHSFKGKMLVGVITSLWLVTFLIFIAPFDASDLSFQIRMQLMIPYGIFMFTGYMFVSWIEKLIYSKYNTWSVKQEILSYFILFLVVLPPTVLYYKSDIVRGDYPELYFILQQYVPIIIIITPVLFILRAYVSKRTIQSVYTIRGENKRDILKITMDELVAVSSSDNYVEVVFLKDGSIHKKLIRTQLKKVEAEFSLLKRVHRSHLVNPSHFVEWKNKDVGVFAGIEIPISKQFKRNVEE